MIETLSTVMIVIFFILVVVGSISATVGAVLLWRLTKKVEAQTAAQEARHKEIVDGQFNLAEILKQAFQGSAEFQGKAFKDILDTTLDAIEKNADDVLKLNTENSQKLYDAVFVLIQMMNGYLTQMGYRPAPPPVDGGLEDPKKGQNYNAPPAQDVNRQDGLTFKKY